jgi:hypothetical protein
MRNPALFVLSVTCAAALSFAQEPAPQRLPIRKAVLYKHGIGYFERRGTVQGNAEVELAFEEAQMKDVLKSLFALDLGGGRVSTMLYDSQDPIEKQLEDIPYRVPGNSALTSLLQQLQGVRVRVTVGAQTVVGRVLGLEPITQKSQDGVVTTQRVVLLRDNGNVEALDVFAAEAVEVLDENVREDLGRMMEVLGKARHAGSKTVRLRAQGDGERELRVGYILETPIWKTSYRLLLEGDQPPRLQGWAIVENRTDEDWNEIELSLVAGSPRSFVIDLYTSYYPQRPVLPMGLGAADQAPAAEQMRARAMQAPTSPAPVTGSDEFFVGGAKRMAAEDVGEAFDSTVEPVAQGVAVGELFQYAAKAPVSIARQKAGLVPILAERVANAQRVLSWRSGGTPYPSHAIYFANATGLTLEKGPVTVFEGATCLGESMLSSTSKQGMRIMLPYAVESAVEVEPRVTQDETPVTKASLVHGVLLMEHTRVMETRYAVRNKSGKAHVLYLDHAKAGGAFVLVAPKPPHDELPAHYRFEVQVPAEDGAELVVREEYPVQTEVQVATQSGEQIRFWARQAYLDEATRALLASVGELMQQREDLNRRMQMLAAERQRLGNDQDNLRKNIQVLGNTPNEMKLRDGFVQRLTKAIERIDAIDRETSDLQQQRADLDQKIGELLSKGP